MSRRENRVLPILYDLIDRLVEWGVLDRKDWTIGWDSLLEASPDDKLDRAAKMSTINQQMGAEAPFMQDEVREAAGFKPADEIDGFAEFTQQRAEQQQRDAQDAATVAIPQDEVTQ